MKLIIFVYERGSVVFINHGDYTDHVLAYCTSAAKAAAFARRFSLPIEVWGDDTWALILNRD